MTTSYTLPRCARGDTFAQQLLEEFKKGQSVQNELAILIDALFNKKDYREAALAVAGFIEVNPFGYNHSNEVKRTAARIGRAYPN